jgi:hypothetical protein
MPVIDPELLNEFLKESNALTGQCHGALAQFIVSGEAKCFADFGLYIDRIMGTALTMDFNCIGALAQIGKELSYKGSQVTDRETLFAVLGLLSQLLNQLDKGLGLLKKGQVDLLPEQEALIAKLKKASLGLGDLRGMVSS